MYGLWRSAIPDITIREARHEDFPALRRIFDEGDRVQREALPWLFHDGRGEFPSETYISGLIEREDVALFVAASRDALVGTVTVRSMRPPDFPSLVPHAYASVDSLVVLPEWRQRGIATALMGVCEERAREWGATRIELVVYEFNDAAQVLYERLGYETLSRRLTRHL